MLALDVSLKKWNFCYVFKTIEMLREHLNRAPK